MIGIVRERLAQPDARRGVRARRVSAHGARRREALDRLIDDAAPLVVVDIEVPEETLVERLSARRICGDVRLERRRRA